MTPAPLRSRIRTGWVSVAGIAVVAAPLAAPCGDFARWRNLVSGGRLAIEAVPGLEAASAAWAAELSRLSVLTATVGASSDGARALVASCRDPGPLSGLEGRIPVSFSREGIDVAGTVLSGPRDYVVFACADPDRSEFPLFGVVGTDLHALRGCLDSVDLPRTPSVHAFLDGEPWREWSVGPDGVLSPGPVRGGSRGEDAPHAWEIVREAPPFRFLEEPGANLEHCAGRLEGSFRWTLAFYERLSGRSWSEGTIEIRLYAHPEDKMRATGDPSGAHANRAVPRLHVTVSPEDCAGSEAVLARLVGRRLLGPAAEPWLEEGLAAAAARRWVGEDVFALALDLQDAAAVPSIRELREPRRWRGLSPLRTVPTGAALALSLFTSVGPRAFLRFYTGEISLPTDPALEALLRSGLERLRASPALDPRPPRGRAAPRLAGGIQRGAFLRDDPAAPVSFGSRAADRSLERLAAAGAGWVFLTPRAWDPSGLGAPGFAPEPDALRNLAEIEWAARRARSLGLRVGLRPIRTRIHAGTWEWNVYADPSVAKEEGAPRRFDLAVHYAIVARRISADLLVIGTDEDHSAGRVEFAPEWRRLLASVRSLFPGAVAYATRGDFPVRVPFLEDLDYLGVDVFDPDPDAILDRPDPASILRARMDRWADLVKGSRTPLLLLEAGFRVPTPGPRGSEPAVSRWGEAMRALRDAAAGRPEIFGVHWWGWRLGTDEDFEANRRDIPRSEDVERVFRDLFGAPSK